MRKLLAALSLSLSLSAGPAGAWLPHGVASGGGSGSSPIVLPGADQPTPAATSAQPILAYSPGYNTITPTQHGSSGDYGYGVKGSIRWDGPQFVNIAATTQVGLFAWHTATAAQIAAGQATNIDHVNVRCDNGSWYSITGPTVNTAAGNTTDWNFTVVPGNFAAGMHKCDAVAVPTTGPDIIAEGPASDQFGHAYETLKATLSRVDSGGATWGVAGNILTISDPSLLNWNAQTLGGVTALSYGMSVSAVGAGANTFIDGDSTHNATSCAAATGANCTGAGQSGTYHLTQAGLSAQAVFTATISGTTLNVSSLSYGVILDNGGTIDGPGMTPGTYVTFGHDPINCPSCTGTGGTGTYLINNSQTFASPTVMYAQTGMTFNTERSFYFTTGVNPPVAYVSLSGNDSTGTGTATSPFLTIGKAEDYILANGAIVGSSWKGLYGGEVCLENGSTYTYSNQAGVPGGTLGYLDYRSAKAGDALCPHTGDPGGATIVNDLSSRSFWPTHVKWSYVNFTGIANDQGGGGAQYLVGDHVVQTHDHMEDGGIFGNGGYYCLEVTSYFGPDGGCSSAVMVRGSTLKYAADADGLHDVPVEVNNIIDGVGNHMEWMTATFDSSTPNVLRNVTILPAELSGYTLSQILANPGAYTLARTDQSENGATWNCLTAANNTISSIDNVAHTITLSGATSAGHCANGYTGYVFFRGAHADLFQLQVGAAHEDVYIAGNKFNLTYTSYGQAAFPQTLGIASFYLGYNKFHTDPTGNESMFDSTGLGDAMVGEFNVFDGTASFGNFENFGGFAGETWVGDTCINGTAGSTFTGKGTPTHRKAAATSACYVSAP